jgi:hypothetical protein
VSVDSARNSFAVRNSVANKAEVFFENYMSEHGTKYYRLGFDEKNERVPFFWNVPPILRSLPDYLISKPKHAYFVHVKGTNKLKLNDFLLAKMFNLQFCQADNTELLFCFCFEGNEPMFFKVETVQELLTGLTVEAFANDGNQYFSLDLTKGGDFEWIKELKPTKKC